MNHYQKKKKGAQQKIERGAEQLFYNTDMVKLYAR